MGSWAWLLALEVGMADTARLVLFSSVYLFLPSFILILSPGRFQLKSINCWDVSLPPCRGRRVQFGCGLFLAQKEEQQDRRAVPVLGVCLSVCTAEVPCTCCTLIFGLSHTSTAAAGPLLCATKACPPSGALCVPPGFDGPCWVSVEFYFNLYFSCKPKLEVCETADLMLRDNFGQFSVGSETLGEVWEVPHKK